MPRPASPWSRRSLIAGWESRNRPCFLLFDPRRRFSFRPDRGSTRPSRADAVKAGRGSAATEGLALAVASTMACWSIGVRSLVPRHGSERRQPDGLPPKRIIDDAPLPTLSRAHCSSSDSQNLSEKPSTFSGEVHSARDRPAPLRPDDRGDREAAPHRSQSDRTRHSDDGQRTARDRSRQPGTGQ
jgi:hypothetical protein